MACKCHNPQKRHFVRTKPHKQVELEYKQSSEVNMRLLLTAIPGIAPGRVRGQHVQSPSLTLLLKMFVVLQALHYSSSESALRECHLICAAGRTVPQIRWKMMQILINHADKTISIPTACSTYYLSLSTEPQLLCSAPWLEAQHWYPAPLHTSSTNTGSGPQVCGVGRSINELFPPHTQLLLCTITGR